MATEKNYSGIGLLGLCNADVRRKLVLLGADSGGRRSRNCERERVKLAGKRGGFEIIVELQRDRVFREKKRG